MSERRGKTCARVCVSFSFFLFFFLVCSLHVHYSQELGELREDDPDEEDREGIGLRMKSPVQRHVLERWSTPFDRI